MLETEMSCTVSFRSSIRIPKNHKTHRYKVNVFSKKFYIKVNCVAIWVEATVEDVPLKSKNAVTVCVTVGTHL
jgi:hypothetical protein